MLFGFGVLVWGQIITTIPTKRIPKQFSWGSGPPEEIIDATSSLVEDGSSGSLSQDVKRTGQILWIRGLTRLQTQVCLIQLHNSTVSQQLSLKRQSIGSPTSPTALLSGTGGSSGSGLLSGSGSASGPLAVSSLATASVAAGAAATAMAPASGSGTYVPAAAATAPPPPSAPTDRTSSGPVMSKNTVPGAVSGPGGKAMPPVPSSKTVNDNAAPGTGGHARSQTHPLAQASFVGSFEASVMSALADKQQQQQQANGAQQALPSIPEVVGCEAVTSGNGTTNNESAIVHSQCEKQDEQQSQTNGDEAEFSVR